MTTPPDSLEAVRSALGVASVTVDSAEIVLQPKTYVTLQGNDAAQALRLLEALEDHDDVQNVFVNFELSDALMAKASA